MDLSTTYMGLKLKNPVVPGASPLSSSLDGIRRLEDAGAPAVVMHSLFEEQIALESNQLDHYLDYFREAYPEALTWFPEEEDYHVGPGGYLEAVSKAKQAVSIPIIASLNGVTPGGWVSYAKQIQDAGADAIELNPYFVATDPDQDAAAVEQRLLDILVAVKANTTLPIAMKISPFFSAMAHLASQLAQAGAGALVLFNRFYQPDLDLEELEVVPSLTLSTSADLRLPLRWVAILYGKVPVDMAITSGVHTHEDVLKGLMAGAKVTQVTSELLLKGPSRIAAILDEVQRWGEEHEYKSVAQMQGSMSQKNVAEPAAFERANYAKTLQAWKGDPTGVLI
jgi:dihydroorotate dehydrogenase (fumarate)